jgi:hypothetical protein
MNRSCLKNLLFVLMLFGAVASLVCTASGPAAQTDTGEQTVTNSITIHTGVGAAVEMSSPLEVSCERLSTLEKVGQGKPAEVTNNPGAQRSTEGSTVSAVSTTGKTAPADASQVTIPSHGRILTLKIAEGHVALACDDATRPDNMPPSR